MSESDSRRGNAWSTRNRILLVALLAYFAGPYIFVVVYSAAIRASPYEAIRILQSSVWNPLSFQGLFVFLVFVTLIQSLTIGARRRGVPIGLGRVFLHTSPYLLVSLAILAFYYQSSIGSSLALLLWFILILAVVGVSLYQFRHRVTQLSSNN
jgi:hypothetical protein